MKMCCLCALLILLALSVSPAHAQALLPSGWPNQLELGMADGPGGAAAMKGTAPFAFRYQYLSGGANTGTGWATWNSNGDFARFYIQDSATNGIVPVFTYYMLLQSTPGGGAESDADFTVVGLSQKLGATWLLPLSEISMLLVTSRCVSPICPAFTRSTFRFNCGCSNTW
jgi:hypothetical protein